MRDLILFATTHLFSEQLHRTLTQPEADTEVVAGISVPVETLVPWRFFRRLKVGAGIVD